MSSPSIAPGRQYPVLSRAIPMTWILLLALAIHGPILLFQMPNDSQDASLHKFFASHYAQHWFNPWNEKWFAGFSQTSYPPLVHQWIALFSRLIGLNLAYALVQMIGILLLAIGVYRYARIWLGERGASYAAVGSVFLGSLALLVYQSGQVPATWAAALFLNALTYFYEWSRGMNFSSLMKGVFLTLAAAAAQLSTLSLGGLFFAVPVFATAIMDRKRGGREANAGAVVFRAIIFVALAAAGVGFVLWPYFNTPSVNQLPLPNASRDNYIYNIDAALNYWIFPWGAMILALPFIFSRGLRESRYLPLFIGLWFTMVMGLGGTTPLARIVLGRGFDSTTFDRFTFWATLMALPLVGLLAVQMINRHARNAVIILGGLATLTFGFALAWPVKHSLSDPFLNPQEFSSFLNRDGHEIYRYLTLGFGSRSADVAMNTVASSVDGEYTAGRLLPELTPFGSLELNNARYYGAQGMEALRAILRHSDQYGLHYIFVRDPYYEPLLAFAGWHKEEVYDRGIVTLWVKEGIPPAHPIDYAGKPTATDGLMWGTLPIGSSIVALLLVLVLPDRRKKFETIEFPLISSEQPVLREAR